MFFKYITFRQKRTLKLNNKIVNKRKIHSKTLKKWFTAARSFFSQWKICVDRAAYFFLFFGRAADKEKRESEANTKKHVFTRRKWIQVIISKKKFFDFFAIAWAEPRFSVCPSVLSRPTARTERNCELGMVLKDWEFSRIVSRF